MPRSIATPRPPGRDASPSQGYPLAVGRQHTLIHLGEERQKWSEVPRLNKQHDGQDLNHGSPDPEFEMLRAQQHTPLHT